MNNIPYLPEYKLFQYIFYAEKLNFMYRHSAFHKVYILKNQDARSNKIFPVFRLVASSHFAAPPIKQFFPLTHLLRRLKHAPRTVAMLAKCAKAPNV